MKKANDTSGLRVTRTFLHSAQPSAREVAAARTGIRELLAEGDVRHATADREAWVRSLRRVNELQEDALAPVFDERWGEIEDGHRAFVERFLSLLPRTTFRTSHMQTSSTA